MDREISTVKQVADYLGVHPNTIRNEIRRERLRAFYAGRRVLISKQALDNYIEGASPESRILQWHG